MDVLYEQPISKELILTIRSLTSALSGLDGFETDLSWPILSKLDKALRISTLILNDEDDGPGFARLTCLACLSLFPLNIDNQQLCYSHRGLVRGHHLESNLILSTIYIS